ncbi:MAG TPA: MarR family transcriptional regulator [Alphaproteobacteria bacterium]
MTDLKAPVNPLFLREQDLNRGIELLYFGYRDFVAEPDRILAPLGFGRAHHRVIYFIGRNADISVAQLLDVLQITKQSLSRVLGQLVRTGYVRQRQGTRDRRQRLLSLTDKGRELERRLSDTQRTRIARAYRAAGAEAVVGFQNVMLGLMTADDRGRFETGD